MLIGTPALDVVHGYFDHAARYLASMPSRCARPMTLLRLGWVDHALPHLTC